MFTGIIEEVGLVRDMRLSGDSGRLLVGAQTVLEGTRLGDSIAVNGVCLTVTSLGSDSFTADVMPETVRRTSLRDCRSGSRVNLERAMAANGRFGGHIVAGHVDGIGEILSIRKDGNASVLTIGGRPELLRYIVEKGSVALDGVSLTVISAERDRFSVGIIPHTGSETTLLSRRPGDILNIETDIIGKYVERLLQPWEQKSGGLTMEYLQEIGF
ncbi:MAG: riboflavin synthase [Oscillospiraceae bacterium]|nr:riboflavin synthase [Oscillospiraceae bacterium]